MRPKFKNYLIANGFQIINLEGYSLDEQVMLFSNAEFVIGFHGAGLANLVYSTARTSVLEIVDKDCIHPCYIDGLVIPGKKATRTYYHMLSHMKNMKYSCIESEKYVLRIDKLSDKIVEMKTGYNNA